MKRSVRVVVGLVLNVLLVVPALPTLVMPTTGPAPVFINVITGVLAVITLAGVVLVWRATSPSQAASGSAGSPAGVVLIVVSQALTCLVAVGGLMDDIPAALKAFIVVGDVLTVLAIVLVLPARRVRALATSAG